MFFTLAKHCGFDKTQVKQLTLPQVALYMKNSNKWIKFEAETRAMPMGGLLGMMGGGSTVSTNTEVNNRTGNEGAYTNHEGTDEEGYSPMTEDDFIALTQAIG